MYKFERFIQDYKREYGLKKYRKINRHISNSDKTESLIRDVINQNSYPYGEDIVVMVLSHFRYSFATSETVLVASLIALKMLIKRLKSSSIPVDESMINKIGREIYKECIDAQIR